MAAGLVAVRLSLAAAGALLEVTAFFVHFVRLRSPIFSVHNCTTASYHIFCKKWYFVTDQLCVLVVATPETIV